MVNPKFVMCYSERLLTQFWKKAEAISHKGKNILLVPLWAKVTLLLESMVTAKAIVVKFLSTVPLGHGMVPSC